LDFSTPTRCAFWSKKNAFIDKITLKFLFYWLSAEKSFNSQHNLVKGAINSLTDFNPENTKCRGRNLSDMATMRERLGRCGERNILQH
jgi:hypothetical protein